MNYTIWTSNDHGKTWDEMLSGFTSSLEALTWLMVTYQPNTGFWDGIEVKVTQDKRR